MGEDALLMLQVTRRMVRKVALLSAKPRKLRLCLIKCPMTAWDRFLRASNIQMCGMSGRVIMSKFNQYFFNTNSHWVITDRQQVTQLTT